MLVLVRKVLQTIVIDDDVIRITVLGIHGGQVKLGIEAEKNIAVHRKEVFLRIQAEKTHA